MGKLAIAVEKSADRKTGKVSATYAPFASCPTTCPLQANGCYAGNGKVAIVMRRLGEEAAARNATPREIAEAEAAAIRGLTGKRALRLHVGGDCADEETASIVATAAEEYSAKHGAKVWGYTHAWAGVARTAWRNVSMLASVHTVTAAKLALKRGYTPAIVIKEHASKAYTVDGLKVIPCPATIRDDITCEKCKLCWTSRNAAVGFPAHGAQTRKAQAHAI